MGIWDFVSKNAEALQAIAAFLTLIITGVFSYLVWKATQESANVAKSTFELSRQIYYAQEAHEEEIKQAYHEKVIKEAIWVLEKFRTNSFRGSLKTLGGLRSSSPNITEQNLVKYFDVSVRDLIDDAWTCLYLLVDEHTSQLPDGHVLVGDLQDSRVRLVISKFEALVGELSFK